VATALKIVRYITKAIETLRPGDYVLARDEHDADGELVLRQVEEVFQRTAYRLQIKSGADAPVGRCDEESRRGRRHH
jgi:hypothetical protein